MLAVCKGNGLFDVVPEKEFPYQCPFVISDSYAEGKYYVTPSGCMVFHSGMFYDPCRHPTKPCAGEAVAVSFSIQEIVAASASTLVRFDVRSTGSNDVLGEWPIKFYDRDAGKNAVASQVVERILRWQATSSSSSSEEDAAFEAEGVSESAQGRGANIPWRLSRDFIQVFFCVLHFMCVAEPVLYTGFFLFIVFQVCVCVCVRESKKSSMTA
jgi:hypothetical protein